jgi:hypothetical protein
VFVNRTTHSFPRTHYMHTTSHSVMTSFNSPHVNSIRQIRSFQLLMTTEQLIYCFSPNTRSLLKGLDRRSAEVLSQVADNMDMLRGATDGRHKTHWFIFTDVTAPLHQSITTHRLSFCQCQNMSLMDSRLWPKCNRLLRLVRPWDAVTLSWWGGWWYMNMKYQERPQT